MAALALLSPEQQRRHNERHAVSESLSGELSFDADLDTGHCPWLGEGGSGAGAR